MPISTSKISASDVRNAPPEHVVYFVDENGNLCIKDEFGNIDNFRGTDGNTIRNGSTSPNSSIGVDGDFFIDMSTTILYGPKNAGNWTSSISLRGAPGTNGNTILSGSSAPIASQGINGDFYLETTNSRLYGPKASGAWPGTFTSLIGPAGPVSQWVKAYNGANLSTTDFLAKYSELGSVEDVMRFYASYGWKGVINVPAGTYTFGNSINGNIIYGLVAPGIEVKGASSASVTFNGISAIDSSSFIIQGVTIGNNPASAISLRNSSITNVSASGSIDASRSVVFNVGINANCSNLGFYFASFKGGIYANNSNVFLGLNTSVSVSGGFSNPKAGIRAGEGSQVGIFGTVIDNDNVSSPAIGVLLEDGSIINKDSFFTVGKISQTLDVGLQVKSGSTAYLSYMNTLGTVTTKYSQPVNEVRETGAIFDLSDSSFKYLVKSVNSMKASTSDGNVILQGGDIPMDGGGTVASMLGIQAGKIGTLEGQMGAVQAQVNESIPSQFQSVWSALNSYGEGLTEVNTSSAHVSKDEGDFVISSYLTGSSEELFRLDENKNLHATVINRRGSLSTLLASVGSEGEIATSSDVSGIVSYGSSGEPAGFSQMERASLLVTQNSGALTLPTKFRNLFLTRSSVNTSNIGINFTGKDPVFIGQKVTLWFDNFWNSTEAVTSFSGTNLRVSSLNNGMEPSDNTKSFKWWTRLTFEYVGNSGWEYAKETTTYVNRALTVSASAVDINILPLSTSENLSVKVTISGKTSTGNNAFLNTYSFIAIKSAGGVPFLSTVTAGTASTIGTFTSPTVTIADNISDGNQWIPKCEGVLVKLTPANTVSTEWTCRIEATPL